ncbi:hypothetical protein scyTo_0019693, partial [Scyliorhinus torazame]|nr:hypothetical protein [Scyliorhinus torazame]
QSQTPCPFLPPSPEALQEVHLKTVKCNPQYILQQLLQDEYDDVAPVGLLRKNMKALNILPPIPRIKSGSKKEGIETLTA